MIKIWTSEVVYTLFKAHSLTLSRTETYFLHASLSLLLCLWLHCDDLKSHLLTWIRCRQEQNLAETQRLHPPPSLSLSISVSLCLPLNQYTWHRDWDKRKGRQSERKKTEKYMRTEERLTIAGLFLLHHSKGPGFDFLSVFEMSHQ